MSKTQNQQNPPLPNKKCVDSKGNKRFRFATKDGGTTMPWVEGLTKNGCEALEIAIRDTIDKLGGKIIKNIKFVNF